MSLKTVKFIFVYIGSIATGNLLIYVIDRIGVSRGQQPMTLGNFIVFNAIIIGVSVLAYMLVRSEKGRRFINKLFK